MAETFHVKDFARVDPALGVPCSDCGSCNSYDDAGDVVYTKHPMALLCDSCQREVKASWLALAGKMKDARAVLGI